MSVSYLKKILTMDAYQCYSQFCSKYEELVERDIVVRNCLTFMIARDRKSESNNSDCNSNFLFLMLTQLSVPSPLQRNKMQ